MTAERPGALERRFALSQRGTSARTEVLAGVIKSDPDWTLLPGETPAPIRRLLGRCLQKDPKRRLRDIGDAETEIDDAFKAPRTSSAPSATPS